MKPDTVLTLGDFTFINAEVPESLPFGGEQTAKVHRLIGGKRQVDAMGPDARPIEWTGLLRGAQAVERGKQLDAMRKAGKPVECAWWDFRYTVLVQRFEADFKRFYEVPYSISCIVIDDLSDPSAPPADETAEEAVDTDLDNLDDVVGSIGSPVLSDLIGGLRAVRDTVGRFATATQEVISTAFDSIGLVRDEIASQISAATAGVIDRDFLGGVQIGIPVPVMAANLISDGLGFDVMAKLYEADSFLGRIERNIEAARDLGQRVVVGGGTDLYRIATQAYGKPEEWTTLARANDLLDPDIDGITELIIPPKADETGGVLIA